MIHSFYHFNDTSLLCYIHCAFIISWYLAIFLGLSVDNFYNAGVGTRDRRIGSRIVSYNASAVKTNKAASSLARFENRSIFFFRKKGIKPTVVAVNSAVHATITSYNTSAVKIYNASAVKNLQRNY
jgi:hypothetical protein